MAKMETLIHLSEVVSNTDDADELITALSKGSVSTETILAWVKRIRNFAIRDQLAKQAAVESMQTIEQIAGNTPPDTSLINFIRAIISVLEIEAAAIFAELQTDNEKRYALLYLFYCLSVRDEKLAYPQGDLRRILAINHETMDRWIAWLVEQGYIEHRMGGRGGRENRLFKITTRGRDLVENDIQSAPGSVSQPTTADLTPFIDETHIARLRVVQGKYDLTRVIRFCEELNSSYVNKNFMSVILLMRALLNHIPPLFGHSNFKSLISQSEKVLKIFLVRLKMKHVKLLIIIRILL